ncbi:unnamed protein product [Chrysodeixis includens]|uniref:Uncharacterized protein n=1 Tax=Chrysodeixis includens TaxID=689277 RepID=A0A9N8PYJ1_CHRIL|nr:unnamed protein product [Chrysodeixis includens]
MATARLYCIILLLYLQGNSAQQALPSNQNVGVNNGVGLQQQTLQQMNAQNINQIQNGGLNMNLPQQSNLQQPNNLQGNTQQPLGLTSSLQVQGSSVPVTNFQFTKQGFGPMSSGFVPNPSKASPVPNSPCNNVGTKQNAQMSATPVNNAQMMQVPQQQNLGSVINAQVTQVPQQQSFAPVTNAQITQIPQQVNLGSVTNAPGFQPQNMPISNSLAEIAALKGIPPLYSLFASQNNIPPQQNQQIPAQNFNMGQGQLTDAQKQYLVRSIQSQGFPQNQQGLGCGQAQWRMPGVDNQPITVYQGQPIAPQQPQVFMASPSQNQPPYITVQAQPLSFPATYPQKQPPVIVVEEEPSLMDLVLSELQSDPLYGAYSPYQMQKRESKSSLKSLIPLIIKLLKDKNNNCCNNNCGCPNNGCGNTGNDVQMQSILSQFANQMNSQGMEPIMAGKMAEPPATAGKTVKEPKKTDQTEKNNADDGDSEESSEEDSSEGDDDSEED